MSNTPSDDLYWRLHSLSKILEGSGFIDESQHPDAYATILDAMAFVRGQQPVMREPLTVQEVEQLLAQWSYELHGDRARYLVRMTEAAHGITQNGGSNGL